MIFFINLIFITLFCFLSVCKATWRIDRIYTPIDCLSSGDKIIESDLANFDVLRRFPFDDGFTTSNYFNITGSGNNYNAFRLKPQGEFTLQTTEIFPSGLPEQFSFGSIFRIPQSIIQSSNRNVNRSTNQRSWTLFRVNDLDGRAQFALAYVPQDQTFKVYKAQESKQANVLSFNFSSDFNAQEWNKVHFSFEPHYVSAYVNCQQIGNLSFNVQSSIDQHGDVYLAKYDDDFSTVPLDVQWMALNCDPIWPEKDTCHEVNHVQQVETRTEIIRECCETDNLHLRNLIFEILEENIHRFKGEPGIPGSTGMPGHPGKRGWKGEKGMAGSKGEKGDLGLPGSKGEKGNSGSTGLPGIMGISPFSSKDCIGSPGLPGIPGEPGMKGQKGSSGETIIGPRGNPGVPGITGSSGPQGPPGVCEMCRLFSVENLQTLISQSVAQTKGPVG